jgi:hypothetical protein
MLTDEEPELLKHFTGQHFRLLVIEWARFEPIVPYNLSTPPPDPGWKPKIYKIGDQIWPQQMIPYLHLVSDLRQQLLKSEKPNQAPEPTPTAVTPPAGQEARQP